MCVVCVVCVCGVCVVFMCGVCVGVCGVCVFIRSKTRTSIYVCGKDKQVNTTQTEPTAVQINNITLPYLILHVVTGTELLVTLTVTT